MKNENNEVSLTKEARRVSKTKKALYVIFAVTILGNILEFVWAFRTGNTPDFSGLTAVYACIAVGFFCIDGQERLIKKITGESK